ncbi:hypothetical protein C8R42DRAFT_644538 [Lentinula raphanica]|nr:hypothetical protein C8R42DRAFT_644538 [Lentinula raphanica]
MTANVHIGSTPDANDKTKCDGQIITSLQALALFLLASALVDLLVATGLIIGNNENRALCEQALTNTVASTTMNTQSLLNYVSRPFQPVFVEKIQKRSNSRVSGFKSFGIQAIEEREGHHSQAQLSAQGLAQNTLNYIHHDPELRTSSSLSFRRHLICISTTAPQRQYQRTLSHRKHARNRPVTFHLHARSPYLSILSLQRWRGDPAVHCVLSIHFVVHVPRLALMGLAISMPMSIAVISGSDEETKGRVVGTSPFGDPVLQQTTYSMSSMFTAEWSFVWENVIHPLLKKAARE